MKDPATCPHTTATIEFKRNGTRLHPNVWMEERCLDCCQVLDTKKMTRGQDPVYRQAK